MWDLIVFLLVGALAGWLASKINGTDDQQGWIMNIVMGVIGAFVGGLLYQAIFDGDSDGNLIMSIIVATVGALIFSWVISKLTGRKTLA
jgi:uncharacterized membrane protein YeaQ/YmgE (transglycosylase-associated protein family)